MPMQLKGVIFEVLKGLSSYLLKILILVQIVSLAACYYNVDVKDKGSDASNVTNQVDQGRRGGDCSFSGSRHSKKSLGDFESASQICLRTNA